MYWEVWWAPSRTDTRWLLFESEQSAVAFYKSLLTSKMLFGPDDLAKQEHAGAFDFSDRGVPAMKNARHQRGSIIDMFAAARRGDRWHVCCYVSGGVQLRAFALEDAARTYYKDQRCSKVLFCPDQTLKTCSTASNDSSGLGVALIMKIWKKISFEGSEPSPKSAADALRDGEVPFVPPDRTVGRQRAMSMVVNNIFNRHTTTAFGCLSHPNRSLCYYDARDFPGVEGYVALTIDDAPCPLGRENSKMSEVLSLLEQHQAHATFMLVGRFADGHEQDLVDLLRQHHELGNHCMLDRAYHNDNIDSFSQAVDDCSSKILDLQRQAGVPESVSWFRAPHGKYTPAMEQVILERGLHHVLCDTYACCPVIQNGDFIGNSLAKSARDGSVIVIHMPSMGVREWCYDGLRCLLEGLQARNLRAVTVSELAMRAESSASPLQLQWIWNSAFEADFLGQWSAKQIPRAICDELDRQTREGAVKIRTVGQPYIRQFGNPHEASQWIRRELLEEFSITLSVDSDRGANLAAEPSRHLLVPSDDVNACTMFLVDELPRTLLQAWNQDNPQQLMRLGDQIVEVNEIRGDVAQLRRELETSIGAEIKLKLRRGRLHLMTAPILATARAASQPKA